MRPSTPAAAVMLLLAAGLPVAAQDTAFVEHNEVMYRVEKDPHTGERTYFHGGRAFTHEELRAHVAGQAPRILTPHAEALLAGAAPGQMVDLVVFLREQPGSPIAREVWAEVDPIIQQLSGQMRELTARGMPRLSLPPHLEAAVVLPLPRAEDLRARRELAEIVDDLLRAARQEIFDRTHAAVQPSQNAMALDVARLGGQVTMRVSAMNVMAVRIPAGAAQRLAADPRIARIDIDHPGEPELNISCVAIGADTGFWASNITGGVFDAGVLDTGVQMNHPALSSHPYLSNMGATDTGDHGTHVAGIMVSTDAVHRGVAWGADHIIFALAGSITTSMPGMNYIASTGEADVCNYSFGNGTASTNDYTPTDQFFDGVIHTFRYIVSKSTGNGGFGSGNPTITHPAPAFNLLACANLDDKNTTTRTDDWISSGSSRGPTAGGRKKPDIGAPGTNILSANKNWASGAHFVSKTGTSMAAPHVGGAVLLLLDAGVVSATAAKAILINTAEAINDNGTSTTADDFRVPGSLWNRRYGWGYMDLAAAHYHSADFFVDTVTDQSAPGRFRLYTGQMFTHEKATLTWERHVAANGATYPTQIESLSDLDLFAYSAATGSTLASSTSAIDNVEQLHVNQDGPVVLKVKAVGQFDPDIEHQEFALATQENFVAATGPAFAADFVMPPIVAPGAQFELSVDVGNTGDLAAFGVSIQLSGLTIVSGPNPADLGAIAASGAAQAVWTVEAPGATGAHPVSVSITSSSYGELFTGSGNASLEVGIINCYANCDGSAVPPILNVADFTCFLAKFAAGDPYANCDGSTEPPVLNVADFACFLAEFAAGCN
jgi:serine protease AprX